MNIFKLLLSRITPKIYLRIGVTILIVISSYSLYRYIENIKEEVVMLQKDNTILKNTVDVQEDVIDRIKTERKEINKLNKDLQEDLKTVEKENNRLNKLFREHDLTDLAKRKPGLIEKRINDATEKVFDDIESITNN
jgi:predicted nuclease with TOPRIM domain